MKKTLWLATFLMAGAGAVSANAVPIGINGSDTLHDMLTDALADCGIDPANGAIYVGGGSTTGEAAMMNLEQEIAGMSRYMRARTATGDICAHPEDGRNAEGIAFSLDGLSIGADVDNVANCGGADGDGGLRFSGNIAVQDLNVNNTTGLAMPGLQCGAGTCPATYSLTGWEDVIRVLFHGLHNASAGNVRDCNSDVRYTLASNWAANFEGGSCAGGGCTRIEQLFRRADLSGTTDTFLSIIGGGAFCNGNDQEDNDPIRRSCSENNYNQKAVCNTYRTQVFNAAPGTPERAAQAARRWSLGLLQAVLPPEAGSFEGDDDYPQTQCSTNPGPARAAPYLINFVANCPCGEPPSFNQCRAPRDAAGEFGCVLPNVFSGRPSGFGIPTECDFRVYNYAVRRAGGLISTDPQFTPPRQRLASGYRMQWRLSGTVCNDPAATPQIGCLLSTTSCTMGFAGREMCGDGNPANDCMEVDNVEPTDENVRLLGQAGAYPISRELYVNSIVGFDAVLGTALIANNTTGGARTAAHRQAELQLAGCVSRESIMGPIINDRGFITLGDWTNPADPRNIRCVDFPETNAPVPGTGVNGGCSLAPPANNACAANPVVNIPSHPTGGALSSPIPTTASQIRD